MSIFPPSAKGGVPPSQAVNGYTPQHPVINGEGPLYIDKHCQTTLTDKQLNTTTSEILAAIDIAGNVPYDASRVDNLGRALNARFNAIAQASDVVQRSGDSMIGQLQTIPPVGPNDAANKGYVDGEVTAAVATAQAIETNLRAEVDGKVAKAGDSMTGPLFLSPLIPTVPSMAASKEYVDREISRAGTFVDAPEDNQLYARRNAVWTAFTPGGGGGGINHAPSDGGYYASRDGAWQVFYPGLESMQADAPSDNSYYARRNGVWAVAPSGGGGINHAPSNGLYYASRNGAWEAFTPGGGATGIPEAPAGNVYGRNGTAPGTWQTVVPTTGGTMTGPLTMYGSTTINFSGTAGIADRYFFFTQTATEQAHGGMSTITGTLTWYGGNFYTGGVARAGAGFWVGTGTDFGMFIENPGNPLNQHNVIRMSQSMAIVLDYPSASWAFHVLGNPVTSIDSGGSLTIWGTATKSGGGPWSDFSDARIKNVLGDYVSGLGEILQLKPVRYTFKGNDTPRPAKVKSPHKKAAEAGTEFIGLTAQDCETAMPELVKRKAGFIDGQKVEDLRELDPGPLIFALINAVKELTKRVQALEAAR